MIRSAQLGICLVLIVSWSMAQAPSPSWNRTVDAHHDLESPTNVVTDANGNAFIISTITRSASEDDYMTIKYNGDGVRKAVDTLDPGSTDEAKHADLKGAYIYVTGKGKQGSYYHVVTEKLDTALNRSWSVTFNAGVSQNDEGVRVKAGVNDTIFVGLNSKYTASNPNIRVVKYYPNGTGVTTANDIDVGGGGDDDFIADLAVDQNNSVYVAGWIDKGTQKDWYVMKFDRNLNTQWTKIYPQVDIPYPHVAIRVAVDTSGNVYSTCGDNPDGTKLLVFRASDGAPLDTVQWEIYSGQETRGLSVRNNDRTVYISAINVPGYTNTLLAKFTNSGSQWSKAWDANYTMSGGTLAYGMTIDTDGNVFIAGDRLIAGTPDSYDFFLTKFNSSDGSTAWGTLFDGSVGGKNDNCWGGIRGTTGGDVYIFGKTRPSLFVETTDLQLVKYDVGGSFSSTSSLAVGPDEVLQETSPIEYSLSQNYPNPFNPATTIQFTLIEATDVTVKIFDAIGREVLTVIDDRPFEAGTHEVTLNASGLASGAYYYKVLSRGRVFGVRKMVLMK